MSEWLQSEPVRPYVNLIWRILVTIFAVILIVILLPVAFNFFLPFILAFVTASAMNPLISKLQAKLRIKRGILSVLMVLVAILLVLAIVGGLIFAIGREIVQVAQNIDNVLEQFSATIDALSYNFNWMLAYVPAGTDELFSGIADNFMLWVAEQGTALADSIIANTVDITARVGGGVVSVVIYIMATYFMMADYPRIAGRFAKILGRKTNEGYSTLKNVTLSALGGYMRAQLLMALAVFMLTLALMLIIRQESALLLAFLFGILDFLPIVGTAIVLVPWGIVNLIGGDIFRGLYLLGMSLVAFLMRRMIEPKIVGDQMGLSPLTALLSIYVGMQLGGVPGLILGPIVAMVLVNLHKAGVFNGWKRDIKAVVNDIRRRSEPAILTDSTSHDLRAERMRDSQNDRL